MQRTEAESVRLQAEGERVVKQIEYTDNIAHHLAGGDLTLAGAVDALEPVLRYRRGFETLWQHEYRAPTFRHGVARYAIMKVRYRPGGDRDGSAAILLRLEAEYAALRE